MSTEACCCKAAGLIKKSCVHGALVGSVTQGAIGAVSGALSGAVTHRITTGSWKGAGQAALDGAATGFMTGTITGAISGAVSSPYCFVAGTTVLTAAGAAAIETIEVGDYVWAWDENTKDVALKQVVETYVNETDELVHVFVNGEEIVTTPAHPFYSPVKGWTDAVHLRAGDILVLVNGEYVVVEEVQHELLESGVLRPGSGHGIWGGRRGHCHPHGLHSLQPLCRWPGGGAGGWCDGHHPHLRPRCAKPSHRDF